MRINRAFGNILGYEEGQLAGRPLLDLARTCNDPSLFVAISQALETAGRWEGELACTARNGSIYHADASLLRTESGVILLLKDLFRQGEDATLSGQHDPLTGLPNQYLLKDRLEQALAVARRGCHSVAVLIFGVDHFTRINDGLGHHIGDQVLMEVAQRLRGSIRRSDTVARFDGDRFVLLLSMRAANDTTRVLEKILKAVNMPMEIAGQTLAVTASIGVSIYPQDTDIGTGLMQRSNSAMLYAKKAGRNGFQFFSEEMNARARQQIGLENGLRRALADGQFVLFYQPKVELQSGRIVGAEALVRWQHPERGLVGPSEFIPVAEECGLIVELGDWVTAEACRQAAAWRRSGLPLLRVSVNMSAPQFRAGNLVESITERLSQYDLPGEALELEITESMLLGHEEPIRQRLSALRERGVYVSIDDFGTGYSSLAYLSRFPITTLKIDRSFVQDLAVNQSTAEIARAIIGLSRGLELEVVAEGVESAEHVAFLLENGCTTVQGFYYSQPVPAAAFEKLVRGGGYRALGERTTGAG